MNTLNIKGSPVKGLIGATVGFFFGSAAVSLFGPSAAHLKEHMTLDPTTIGLLVAIPSLSGSLLRIPFGAWVDTSGGKKPFNILMLLSVIGILDLSIMFQTCYPDHMDGLFPLLILFGCLAGCGIATFSVGIGQISYWFSQQKQGSALGIYAGIGTLAPGLFALLLPLFLARHSLVSAYWCWTVFLLLGTVLYWVLGQNAPYFQYMKHGDTAAQARTDATAEGEQLFPKGNMKQSLAASAKVPATWVLTALYFSTFGGFLALTSWYPTFWKSYFHESAIMAGVLTASFSMFSAAVRVVGGPLSDKIGGRALCMLSMFMMLAGGIGMMFSSDFGWAIAFTILLAIAMGFNNAAVFKLVPFYVPQAVGGASGWVGGFGAFGGFVIPPVMGVVVSLMGTRGYLTGFGVFALLAVISIITLYFGLMRGKAKLMADEIARRKSAGQATSQQPAQK